MSCTALENTYLSERSSKLLQFFHFIIKRNSITHIYAGFLDKYFLLNPLRINSIYQKYYTY